MLVIIKTYIHSIRNINTYTCQQNTPLTGQPPPQKKTKKKHMTYQDNVMYR